MKAYPHRLALESIIQKPSTNIILLYTYIQLFVTEDYLASQTNSYSSGNSKTRCRTQQLLVTTV